MIRFAPLVAVLLVPWLAPTAVAGCTDDGFTLYENQYVAVGHRTEWCSFSSYSSQSDSTYAGTKEARVHPVAVAPLEVEAEWESQESSERTIRWRDVKVAGNSAVGVREEEKPTTGGGSDSDFVVGTTGAGVGTHSRSEYGADESCASHGVSHRLAYGGGRPVSAGFCESGSTRTVFLDGWAGVEYHYRGAPLTPLGARADVMDDTAHVGAERVLYCDAYVTAGAAGASEMVPLRLCPLLP